MNKYSMLSRLMRRKSGQALISILVLMAIGAIILTPVLDYIGTALITGGVFQEKAEDYYSADAGIIDGQWQIDNDRLAVIFPAWNPLKYGDPAWGSTGPDGKLGWYAISDAGSPTQVNSRDVSVQIKNRWVVHGISAPSVADATTIVTTNGAHLWVVGRDTGIIDQTSGLSDAREFQISIFFNPVGNEQLRIVSFGAWLPPGFTYDTARGVDINGSIYNGATFTSVPEFGGTSLVWTLNTATLFQDMPSVNTGIHPLELKITFYQTQPGKIMTAVGWVTTDAVSIGASSVPYTWDSGLHVIQITSKADSTYVDALVIQQERQQVGGSLNGDYYATGNSLLAPSTPTSHYRSILYSSTSATVATNSDPLAGIPGSGTLQAAYLYWSGWIDWEGYNPLGAHDTIILDENCSNFTPGPLTWTAGSRWTISNNSFRAQGQSGSTTAQRTITSSAIPNLGSYTGRTVVLSWTQSGSGVDSNDYVFFKLSNGTTDTGWLEAFHGTNSPTSPFTFTIPQEYLTNTTTLSFFVAGAGPTYTNTWTSTYDYAYIDNISIIVPQIFYDDGTSMANWTNTGTWNINNSQLRGYGTNSTLTLATAENLSSYTGVSLALSFDVLRGTFTASDHLYLSFYNTSGWSTNQEVFVDLSQTSNYVSYLIPEAYKTSSFKMRFTVTGSSSRYVYIDNVTISGPSLEYPTNGTKDSIDNLVANVAKVNQVKFGSTAGNLQTITASTYQVLYTPEGGAGTWCYNAMFDATSLINGWIAAGQVSANGAATYTLKHAFGANTEDPTYSFSFTGGGSTGYPLGTAGTNEYAYCGWSLVLIYSSPDTQGHQLWLYDIMNPNFQFTSGQGHSSPTALDHEPDFNGDGLPGGYISGFLVPENIQSETNSSKITVFVGEGDAHYGSPPQSAGNSDYFEVNGVMQFNADSPAGNVWNSASPGLAISGIDLDTFYLNDPVIQAGDTTAQINVGTNYEYFTLIYIIISFRSDTTTGGAISYLIR
jgi:hypothetical protein